MDDSVTMIYPLTSMEYTSNCSATIVCSPELKEWKDCCQLSIDSSVAIYILGSLVFLLSVTVVFLSVLLLICGKLLKYTRKMDAMKRSMQTSESFSLDAKFVVEDNGSSSLHSQHMPSEESMTQTVQQKSEEKLRMVKSEPKYEELCSLDKSDPTKRYGNDPVSPDSDTVGKDCDSGHTEVPIQYNTPVDSLHKQSRLSKRRKGSGYESVMEKSLQIMKKKSTEVLGDDELELGVIVADQSKLRQRFDYNDIVPVTRTRSEVIGIKQVADEATSPQSSHPHINSILNPDTVLEGVEGGTYSKLTETFGRFHQLNQSCPSKAIPVYATIENKEET